MAFNIQPFNFRLTGKDYGSVDYADALKKGFENYKGLHEAANTPKRLSEALLAQQLQNKINQPKAEDAQGWYNMQKKALGDTHGLSGLNLQLLQQKIAQGKYEQDLNNQLFGNGNKTPPSDEADNSIIPSGTDNSGNAGVTAGGPGANYGAPTAANTFPGRTGRPTASQQAEGIEPPAYAKNMANSLNAPAVQAIGNPNMYHVDELIDSDPRAAAALKKRGYEKKVTPHYDAKTGLTSVVTQYPSGKVTVQTSKPADSGYGALTSANITKANDAIMGVTNVMPTIDKLISLADKGEIPGQVVGKYFKTDQQATYNSLSNMSGDTLAKALGFPSTDKGMDAALASIRRADGESDKHYADRLKDYRKDMMERLKNSKQFLRKGVSTSDSNQADPYKLGI